MFPEDQCELLLHFNSLSDMVKTDSYNHNNDQIFFEEVVDHG